MVAVTAAVTGSTAAATESTERAVMAERSLKLVHSRPAPKKRAPVVSNGVFGMLIFVLTEIMFFAALISAQMVVRAQTMVWPPPGQPRLPVEQTALNTGFLVLSGVALWYAGRAFQKDAARAKAPLFASLGFGALFVGLQGVEWVQLLGQGMRVSSSSHAGFFYLIVGIHALHAVGALIGLGWIAARLRRGAATLEQLRTAQVFWAFVVGVWPFIYWQVYL